MDTLRPRQGLLRMEILLIQNAPALPIHRHKIGAIFLAREYGLPISLRYLAGSEEEHETTVFFDGGRSHH